MVVRLGNGPVVVAQRPQAQAVRLDDGRHDPRVPWGHRLVGQERGAPRVGGAVATEIRWGSVPWCVKPRACATRHDAKLPRAASQ